MTRMRTGTTTDDYRKAMSGEGEWDSLGYEWSDKPHRLVYDLCGEVDHLRQMLDLYERYTNRDIKAQIEDAIDAKKTTGKFPFED